MTMTDTREILMLLVRQVTQLVLCDIDISDFLIGSDCDLWFINFSHDSSYIQLCTAATFPGLRHSHKLGDVPSLACTNLMRERVWERGYTFPGLKPL